MPYTLHPLYHAHVLVLQGRFLGVLEGPTLLPLIDKLREEGKTELVIDLSETHFMDSTGIGLLIAIAKKLRQAGGDARLAGLQDRVKNLFVMTRLLGTAFDDYPTAEEAAQSFADTPPVTA